MNNNQKFRTEFDQKPSPKWLRVVVGFATSIVSVAIVFGIIAMVVLGFEKSSAFVLNPADFPLPTRGVAVIAGLITAFIVYWAVSLNTKKDK